MKTIGRLGAALACAFAVQAGAATLEIQGSLDDQGRLLMRYTPPPGVSELPFWPPTPHGQSQWRKGMAEAGDDCTELTPTSLRIKPGCRAATLRVRPKVLAAYATYEPAQPQSDGSGVLLHTEHYAVLLPGAGLHWRWVAPHVLHRGHALRGRAELRIPASEVDQELHHSGFEQQKRIGSVEYVYLGRRAAERLGPAWLAVDGGLDTERIAFVRERLRGSVRAYAQAYGKTLPDTGAVVATLSDLPGYWGDTTPGRMMRLRLPRDVRTMTSEELSTFIAHEVGHWWNKGLYTSDDARSWLHEGHAEWMALVQQTQDGLMSPEQLREQVQGRLNGCLMFHGETAWATLPVGQRDGTEYDCGVSLMQLAQALQTQRQPAATPPLRRLAGLHAGRGHLDATRLAAWADGDRSDRLHRLLSDPDQPFGSGVGRIVQAVGLADSVTVDRTEGLDPVMRKAQAAQLVRRVMNLDCGGSASYSTYPEGFKLGTGPKCQTLSLGQMVVAVQGQALMDRPIEAWDAVHAACLKGDPIRVDYAEGPATQQSCPADFKPRTLRTLVKLRPEALQRWGFPTL